MVQVAHQHRTVLPRVNFCRGEISTYQFFPFGVVRMAAVPGLRVVGPESLRATSLGLLETKITRSIVIADRHGAHVACRSTNVAVAAIDCGAAGGKDPAIAEVQNSVFLTS